MLDRTLTEQGGLLFLGKPHLCADATIDRDHSFAQMELEMRDPDCGDVEDLSVQARLGLEWLFDFLSEIERKAKRQGCTQTVTANASDAFSELLGNSVDHGSDCGRRGAVFYKIWASRKGIFSIVDDPGTGFALHDNAKRILPVSTGRGEGRGQGSDVLEQPGVRVNFEKIQSCFRSLLLVPNNQK